MPKTKKDKPLSIVIVASEAAPYVKTGGLGDVAGALPQALARLGHDVTLIVPLHLSVDRKRHGILDSGASVRVPISARIEKGRIFTGALGGVTVCFIDHDTYFAREGLYVGPDGDYPDNAERFAFFSMAALEAVKTLGLAPDVIHVHDWQTALVPVYMNTRYQGDPAISTAVSALTIHNLGFQGHFPPSQWHLLGLRWDEHYHVGGLEFYGKINFLKGGALFADLITTVSTTYAREIQGPEQGWGLDDVLRRRAGDLFGVVNGIDVKTWNPETDPNLPATYSMNSLEGKRACKSALLKEMGVAPDGRPLLAVVTRLAEQKGIDLLSGCLDRVLKDDVSFVLLGSGQPHYEKYFRGLAKRYPGKAAARIGFDEGLSHRIIAGADMFLMPSRYEPCGLTQMYALAYGTAPVVRATGGLNDTVRSFDPATGEGNGFKFADYSADALYEKIGEAVDFYRHDPAGWIKMLKNGMTEDHSWSHSARTYEALYRRAARRGGSAV